MRHQGNSILTKVDPEDALQEFHERDIRVAIALANRPPAPQIVTGRIGHRARREREVTSAAAVVPRRFSYLRSVDLLPLGRLDASREARKSIPKCNAWQCASMVLIVAYGWA